MGTIIFSAWLVILLLKLFTSLVTAGWLMVIFWPIIPFIAVFIVFFVAAILS